jgi:hypothetical protein
MEAADEADGAGRHPSIIGRHPPKARAPRGARAVSSSSPRHDASHPPDRRRRPARLDGGRVPRPLRLRGRDRRLARCRPQQARGPAATTPWCST